MSVGLEDYTESLAREITAPGATSTVGEDALIGYLADAFWEAKLDGFFDGYTCDEDGVVTPVNTGDPEFDRASVSLVILYAGIRALRNQILNTKTAFRAKSGTVEYEQQNSALVLAEMLKQLRTAKDRLLEQLLSGEHSAVELIDGLGIFWAGP